MPLVPGTRIGQYQITEAIGAGGMGEVYRAQDPRLGRAVAIKVLPESFARDPERLARFDREARTLASLNHPNIAQIYGVEDRAIVMELLDGSTLRDRLSDGPLPVRKAIEVATQMARGLAAAHDRGIVHRDLKPENVFITRDGHVKLLDFGLARPAVLESSGTSETVAATGTSPGMVMGTIGYMAPEQVRGEALDARADLFALGAVLYEMLTGRRAFIRGTAAETMTAILREEPQDITTSQAGISPALVQIVAHCLEKNPIERFQTARDVAFALEALSGTGSGTGSGASAAVARPSSPARSRERWAWAALTTALAALAAWLGFAGRSQPPGTAPIAFRTVVPLPEGTSWSPALASLRLAVAPQSDRVAVVVGRDGQLSSIWIVSLSGAPSIQLPGTDGAVGPFWTADGRRLSFTVGGQLKTIDLSTGAVSDIAHATYADWAADGSAVVMVGSPGQWRVGRLERPGAVPVELMKGSAAGEDFVGIRMIPNSRRFVVTHRRRDAASSVVIGSLDEPGTTELIADGLSPTVAGKYLLFVRGDRLFAQPFDRQQFAVGGQPTPVAERIEVSATVGAAFSATDRVIVHAGGSALRSRLAWVDRSGKPLQTFGEAAEYSNVAISPDGRRVALSVLDSQRNTRDIYVVDAGRGVRQRLTFDPADERSVVWSGDGQEVIFSRGTADRELFRRRSDFTGTETPVLIDQMSKDPTDVSRDGRLLAFRRTATPQNDLWLMALDGDPTPQPLLTTPFDENYGTFSPDAKSIAYVSDESGRPEVYVLSLEPGGGKTQISAAGGSFPRWPNANEIVFLAPGDMLTTVSVSGSGATFRATGTSPLFKINPVPGPGWPFDVTADGQRFVVNERLVDRQSLMNVIVDWQALLEPAAR